MRSTLPQNQARKWNFELSVGKIELGVGKIKLNVGKIELSTDKIELSASEILFKIWNPVQRLAKVEFNIQDILKTGKHLYISSLPPNQY